MKYLISMCFSLPILFILLGCNKIEDKKPIILSYTEVFINYKEDEKLENFEVMRREAMYYTFQFIFPKNIKKDVKNSFLMFIGNSSCVLHTKYGDFKFLKLKIRSENEQDTLMYVNAIDYKDIRSKYNSKENRNKREFILKILNDTESKIIFHNEGIRKPLPCFSHYFEVEIKRSRDFKISYLPPELTGEE